MPAHLMQPVKDVIKLPFRVLKSVFRSVLPGENVSQAQIQHAVAKVVNDRTLQLEKNLQKKSDAMARDIRSQLRALSRQLKAETLACYRQCASYTDLRAKLGFDKDIPTLRGFAISPDLALHLMKVTDELKPKRLLEVGSGFSTVILARYCAQSGAQLVSIDHEAEYAEKTRQLLAAWGLADHAEVIHCPIVEHNNSDGGTYPYYSAEPLAEKPNDFDFVFIDGPPQALGLTVRGALIPTLGDHLANNCRLILDDYYRPGEQEVVDHWVSSGWAKLVSVDKNLEKHAAHLEILK